METLKKHLLVLFSLIFLSTTAYAAEPVIGRVAIMPKELDLSKNQSAEIRFFLSQASPVGLKIFDEADSLVREVLSDKTFQAGPHSLTWDGKNQSGEQVASGVYVYVLESPSYVHDPRQNKEGGAGGEEIFAEKLSWNPAKKNIHYILPKAGYARIRIGLKEKVFLGTLMDWTAQAAGNKEFVWDGKDPSRLMDLSKHPEVQINISAYALPENAIIVKNETTAAKPVTIQSGSFDSKMNGGFIHARHPREHCHDPDFTVELPVISKPGRIPVRITLNPRDKDYLTANRFEIMFFADTQFLFEQEEATSPFTVYLDSARFGEGSHLLTVNVMDYEDHIGVKTMKFSVVKDENV